MSVEVYLHFPDGAAGDGGDRTVTLAALPCRGDTIEWDGEDGYSEWVVTKVAFTARPDVTGSVGLYLSPVPSE
ncbi:hypothetical protein OHA37_27145 [Streptomyces sp. NBC_00335]|uniref:hypothetical protein n=1 Tax=unclassified Streptomyces TaxID=2593676 RepID=UPI00224EF293|nr:MULTISPECIES: hypothetical protein [unclassified Streptomyces]MCX5407528.1 hypothetical protein [Streptomyces sp. NBC_00086]